MRAVHRRFPTGVTVVATVNEGSPFGLAVNAFSSISLEPPLVLVCISATAQTYPKLFENDMIAVSILAEDQSEVASAFARSGGPKFEVSRWYAGENGAPVIEGAAAYLEGTVVRRLPAYTHTIFIVDVTKACDEGKPPLVYLDGAFFASPATSQVER